MQVTFTGAYVETTSGLIAADGRGAGGSVDIDGGTGHLFTSGRQEARGAVGGNVHLLAGQIDVIAGAEDASGTAGAGGHIVVFAADDAQYNGTLTARGGTAGGLIEVSAGGTLNYAGAADAGTLSGPNGSLRLDPKNLVISSTGSFPQYNFPDPNPNPGGSFGAQVLPLSGGNVVVTDPNDSFGGNNAGAVYLFNGQTGALIGSLVGSSANDQVGYAGVTAPSVTALNNGNYVVASPYWNGGEGAVTWGNGTSGISGPVSAVNSLVGSAAGDHVGSPLSTDLDFPVGVTALTNGNYVVVSPAWNGGNGAVTWGSGISGISGPVSAANSLVGSNATDYVGANGPYGVTELSNGNYVVSSPYWNGEKGAVTWGSGTSGISGPISAVNSLIGSSDSDEVGGGVWGGRVTALTNGNYVVASPDWNRSEGAVTWGNGTTGISGPVSAVNSLVGSAAGDEVGYNGVTALTDGNYVVRSPFWNGYEGAVTWSSGTAAISGPVSAANSLVGSNAKDYVGIDAVVALSNGNYVVDSSEWNGKKGAVTWGNGASGVSGPISATNSLVGSAAGDAAGSDGVAPLSNGNYVVDSSSWNGARGAVTWGNGASGISGPISAANSLVGSAASDAVGYDFVTALSNGNYVVASSHWNGYEGAVTWGSGTSGINGPVSATNSLIGSTGGDWVGYDFVTALSNGNYVVASSHWNGGQGAVTWGNGTSGINGPVSASNSLVGSAATDSVGSGGLYEAVTGLSNGNYVVASPDWNGHKGGVTWGSGISGVSGQVSAANSLVGSAAGDDVGYSGVTRLSDGNFLVTTASWNGSVGAVTWINGSSGRTLDGSNAISAQNSLIGQSTSSGLVLPSEDPVDHTFIAAFTTEGSGRVTAGVVDPNLLTFALAEGQTLNITPDFLTRTLNTGTAVVLQADNDITINSPIVVLNPAGKGGDLTLDAGGSILIGANANITTGYGNLTLIANEEASKGVVEADRESGPADITDAANAAINTGTGTVTVIMSDGNTAGSASLAGAITASAVIYSTTTTLTDNAQSPSIAGQPLSFTASVTPCGGSALNGETVNIEDASNNNAVVATPTLKSGTATFSIAGLSAGTHNLFAVYSDATHLASQSGQVTQVVGPDSVIVEPENVAVDVTATATFTAVSALTSIDAVQWQVNTNDGNGFTDISGATATTVSFTASVAQNGYRYRALFTNAAYPMSNPIISTVVTLTVYDAITSDPSGLAVAIGESPAFTATSGYTTDAVRWQVSTDLGTSWKDVPGANSAMLTLANVTAAQDGTEYRAVFTPLDSTPADPALTTTLDGKTVLISGPALLKVDGISVEPSNQNFSGTVNFTAGSVQPGDSVQWQISVDGGKTYQSLYDGGPYSHSVMTNAQDNGVTEGTLTTLTITGASADMLGNEYDAVISSGTFTFATIPVTLVPASLWDNDPSANTVAQRAVAGQPTGITAATGLNNGQSITFSLTENAGGRFAIDPITGAVTVAPGAAINYRDQGYAIQVAAADPFGDVAANVFVINVTDLPPGVPTDTDPTPNSVNAQAGTGTLVGITAFSADPNPMTYSLSDSAGGRFAIDPATGVVTVASGMLLSYPNNYAIVVQASDAAGATAAAPFTININDPTALTIGGFSLNHAVVTGNTITGDAILPEVGDVSLAGTVRSSGQGPQYNLSTASLGSISLDNFTLNNPVFNLTNSGLSLAGSVNSLPLLGNVNVSGTIQSPTDFSLGPSRRFPP